MFVALAARISNAGEAFIGGVPVVSPFDDVYHWKRITHSALHFPSVLEFDPNRGLGGAFCPWPPLYDLVAGGIARLFGATSPSQVLAIIIWIPPLFAALAAGVFALAARASHLGAVVVGVGLATTPFLVDASSIGEIDHHFLEPFFAIAIASMTAALVSEERRPHAAAASLAIAITAALMVQTAMIIAAGLAFALLVILPLSAARTMWAAGAFALPSVVVIAYRATRPPEFPDNAWFLGWTHAILLASAAMALALRSLLQRTALSRITAIAVSLLVPILLTLAVPATRSAVGGGLTFFGGDPWLATIQEFRPVGTDAASIINFFAATGGGIAASFVLLRHGLARMPAAFVIGAFTIAFVAATVQRRRFIAIASTLAVLAVARAAAMLWSDGERRRGIAALVLASTVVVVAPIHLGSWIAQGSNAFVGPLAGDFFRVSYFLRDRGAGARVLAPWSYGHMLHVIGGQKVVLDNFGSMPNADLFTAAHAVLLSEHESDVARYCARHDINFVVLQPPGSMALYAQYARRQTPVVAQRTWYWRAYAGQPLREFRRVARFGKVLLLEPISVRDETRRPASP